MTEIMETEIRTTNMKYVNDLPSMYVGREIMAERILNGLNSRQAVKKLLNI